MPAASTSSGSLQVFERSPRAYGLDWEALRPFLQAVGPVAVVALETTGLADDAAAEVIEVGVVLLDAHREQVGIVDRTVRPRGRVPRFVTALTGLVDASLEDAPPIEAVAPQLAKLLEGRTIVSHNTAFERHFLSRFVAPELARNDYLDTQQLLALTHPDAPDLRLETFSRSLLGREERHRALSDAVDAAGVLSAAAVGARAGEPRWVAAASALETYAERSPWRALLRTPLFPPEETDPLQYIPIEGGGERAVPFDEDRIVEALSDEARGRRWFPGYRVRDEQLRMAREFAGVLADGGRLLLEGGTGVGKSLAYLAAAIPFAMERSAGGIREPILVSTRTKLLQDQLLAKDIPAAAAMLGHPGLRALSIKGRANYVCSRRCQQVLAEGREPGLFADDRLAFASLATCARLRPHGEVGTLPGALLAMFPPLRDLRRRAVAARAEQCTREQCAATRGCPFGRRRAALADAHLVVANHDLLLRWPPDYPPFTHAIVDEAHDLSGVADEVYAMEVRPEAVVERIDDLFGNPTRGRRGPPPRLALDAEQVRTLRGDVVHDLQALGSLFGERAGEFGSAELPPRAARVLPQAAQLARLAADRIEWVAATAADVDGRRGEDEEEDEVVTRAIGDLRDASSALRLAFDEEANDDVVAAFEELSPPFDRWRLALRQVSPARSFHEGFLSKLESFSCVSASLFVNGDAFAALGDLEIEARSELPCWSVSVASPFPYREHMRVVALRDAGDLVDTTADVIRELAARLSGRTLGLFTSLRRMRDVRDRVADALRGEGLDVLMPRRATDDPAALVARFRRSGGGGVLLGARTFWQGLDIPGDALQAVVIEKLPFEVPTELRRRREARLRDQGDDAFERYTLGVMLLNLKQMVGRLIRSEEDRGVVVIVDPRPDRRYFERLDEALPAGCGVRLAGRDELPALLAEAGVGIPETG
ncbi:MAG: helicase C-terminal domain-containing protein [Myxococcota bacterium]